jgi:hypothetical protein
VRKERRNVEVEIPTFISQELIMKINRGYIVVGLMIAFALCFELAAHADESDEATTITFSQPIQIPGKILPAGSYQFKLADPNSDPKVVQIFNEEGTVLYATLPTISTERPEPVGDTVVTFAKQGVGQPDALRNWFYPGHVIGVEFLYPNQQEKEIDRDKQQTIVAGHSTVSKPDTAGN